MHAPSRLLAAALATFFALALSGGTHTAVRADEPGITPTEIVLGGLHPYSGPASAYGAIGKGAQAYFAYINDNGGVNGRKITYKDLDDAYSPPQAVQLAKQLVEQDHVFAMFNTLGTPSNTAIRPYLNQNQVPQLFVATGASTWGADAAKFPWTIGWQPDYQSEAIIYARYLMKDDPNAKIAVLYQNDDYGKDYLKGLKDGLGAKAASMIVAEESYETTEPSVDNHIVKLKSTGADVFMDITTPKFAAQAIKKVAEIEWKPLHIVSNVSASVGSVIKPAGFENAQGILSAAYAKDGADSQWDNDPGMKKFFAFLEKYFPEGNKLDGSVVYGYGAAQTMVKVLEMCGDNLTRENVMKQAASLKDFAPDTLLPGVKINTSATDFAPIKQLQMMRFKGEKWELFGDIISGELSN